MARLLTLLLACLLLLAQARAQGTLRGKVTDAVTGEGLMASLAIKGAQPPISTAADLEGNFSLPVKQSGPVTLVVSFFGYAALERTVTPEPGGVTIINFELREEGTELKEFEIVQKANKRTDTYLDRMKINSAVNFDFISRDAIQKTGDGDASQAVRRVSGVSTVGSFVTVRGLADRYVVTTINGGRVPTLDPFTNNLRLDLFPTGLLDNIIITKTATPDLPGDWSGAYMSLNTSDYPQRLQVSFTTTLGYNPQSSFKQIVSAGSSSTDWLGWDDGMRAIPDGVPDAVEDYPTFVDPNLYQQLSLLGLGGYLNGYGITSSTPGFQSNVMSNNATLQHLALTELGLLPPALLYNTDAVQSAVNTYNSTYNLAYFSPIVNAELAELNTKWDNSRWRVTREDGSPNFNAGFTIGNQVDLFKKKDKPKQLGYLFGFRYQTETIFDNDALYGRTFEPYDDPTPGDGFKRQGVQELSTISNSWSTLGNVSFTLDRNNSFTLTAMGNVMGQNYARYMEFLDPTVSGETFASEDQYWEERKLWAFQYGSKHLIPQFNLTVTPDVSYSFGGRDMLDFKVVQYILPPEGEPITDVDGALTPPGRIYRYLDEDMLDARLGMELPLGGDAAKVRKLKFGGGYRWNERLNEQKYYVVQGAPGPTQWEDPGRFEMRPDGRFTSRYEPFGSFKDNDIGILKVWAAYGMTDYALTKRLRVAGGLRVEHTDLITDIQRFYEEGIAPEDTIRGTVGDLALGGSGSPEPKPAVPGSIQQWDLLPSINLIHRLVDDELAPTNLRLSYFRSLARPSFRELSVVQYYDYALQAPVFGNPELEMTRIDNFDIRLERFFKSGNNVSVSGFYKTFQNHIELLGTQQGGFTWRNANRSQVLGLELEGRAKLTRQLELRGNLTWMESESELTTFLDGRPVDYTTPMFGQAPYIVNTTITYGLDSLGLTLSGSYNVQGAKLAVTNSELLPDGIRAYEMPRHLIDLTASQRLGRNWLLSFRVRDLLNSPIRREYLFGTGYDYTFDQYAYGTEYQLVIQYTIK